jgi:hypothetical protein
MEGMQAQSTTAGVQAQSIEGVDNNIELNGVIENTFDTIKHLQGPKDISLSLKTH